MKRPVPFHPFVLAVYPVIFLYSQNAAEVRVQNTFASLILSLGFALVAFSLLAWWLKDVRKGALLVSLFVGMCFSYGHVVHLMRSSMDDFLIRGVIIGPNKILAPLWALFFVAGCFLILKTKADLSKPTSLLNITAVILTALSLAATGAQSWHLKGTLALKAEAGELEGTGSRGNSFSSTSTPPNIYYIILDEYAGWRCPEADSSDG